MDNNLSRSAHQTTNYESQIFCLFTFSVFLPDKIVEYQQLYWHFLMYFNLNSKLLPGKYIQKVNKQKICCKNSEFIFVELNKIKIKLFCRNFCIL